MNGIARFLDYDASSFSFWNYTYMDVNVTDFDTKLIAVKDVSVDAVVSSLYFNTIVFVLLMATYELLRRLLPAVYSSRYKLDHVHYHDEEKNKSMDDIPSNNSQESNNSYYSKTSRKNNSNSKNKNNNSTTISENISKKGSSIKESVTSAFSNITGNSRGNDTRDSLGSNSYQPASPETWPWQNLASDLFSLPDDKPLDWIGPVFGVPWSQVRKVAGLDGYFFLRYIRMNLRICAVTCFWFCLILVPIYITGSNPDHSGEGWYHISMANISSNGWRMWVPCVLAYLFSGFVIFVIKQEYRHYLDLRQDFLARGTPHVNPQHHYSLKIENIPYELRSDRALTDYFDKLFPGKVHSASVVLNLPDLEEASNRCMRTCRRLEKSIAYLHATGKRPTHIVGRGRVTILGVDLQPLDINCDGDNDALYVDEEDILAERPARGVRVDSISYYTQELAAHSRTLFKMQKRKSEIAESGNRSMQADNWLDKMVREASAMANRIMAESMVDNDLVVSSSTADIHESQTTAIHAIPQAEHMTSRYGSISPATISTPPSSNLAVIHEDFTDRLKHDSKGELLMYSDHLDDLSTPSSPGRDAYPAPFIKSQYHGRIRRFAGRLGLDFVVAGMRFLNNQLDVALEGVVGATMSSTGFVTFLDLSSTTCAASAPLSVKRSVLGVSVAPEPREILWQNAHVSKKTQNRRAIVVNIILFLGVVLWSFPLTAIQVFARAEVLAQIPGMEWILTLYGGAFSSFINGYLPVVALLILICLLPILFELLATKYERRKTFSDVQASMLSRYFYYQVANIYVSVTAGSIIKSLADILDRPSRLLPLLGASLPTMVGYFVALLVTKIMAGLPMIFLRFGALTRMLVLKILSNEAKLTQRELDAVYRLENVQYGWEFPTQLLVVVIVFTYALICPIILPVGFMYFLGALIVYKKQVLFVYSPVYESGGAMFPMVIQCTLFGLTCSQLTLLGYVITRGCYYQPVFLLPLPLVTIYLMRFFGKSYAEPSKHLSLERAREYDRVSAMEVQHSTYFSKSDLDSMENNADVGSVYRKDNFDHNSYRQPVLTELATEPWFYRRGVKDSETESVKHQLRKINRYKTRIDAATLKANTEQQAAIGLERKVTFPGDSMFMPPETTTL